jgi:hypothetical protein
MSDIRHEMVVRYASLDDRGQILLLAKLADRLTLMARDTYDEVGGVRDNVRLRAFNEAQNRILAQLLRLLVADERRYPDDVFGNILMDQIQILKLDPGDIFGMFPQ